MTCGEVYKICIDKRDQGVKSSDIAAEVGVSESYLRSIYSKYAKEGERIFQSTRPFKGTGGYSIPSEEAISDSAIEYELEAQSMTRKIAELRGMIEVEHKINYVVRSGRGPVCIDTPRNIKVIFKGRDYLLGEDDKKIKHTVDYYDLIRDQVYEADYGVWNTRGYDYASYFLEGKNEA